jgi:hypothetical protein
MAILVGCASGSGGASSASVSKPAVSVSGAVDPRDPRPVLTMGYWDYGPTDYWRPKDLAELYVYPDGTAIRVALDGTYDSEVRALQAELFTLDSDQLAELMNLADAAGLTGGGLQPLVALPAGVQIQDGGAAVFTARQGDVQTARAVDQLFIDDPYTVGDRVPFGNLLAALAPWCCEPREDMTVEPLTRWAIVSRPTAGEEPDPEQEWTGPNVNDLTWVDIGNDVKCAIVERPQRPLTLNERRLPWLVLDGRIVMRRPLLPHEHDCNDVAAVRQLLDLQPN